MQHEKLIKHYQKDDALRMSFNCLSERIFGLSFEDWYQWGCWRDNYIPYSIWDGRKIVANVSVSPVKLIHEDRALHLFQLGTVMTDPDCRHKGFSRRLMEEIDRDFSGADGSFLFANDSVTKFYPRFGYEPSKEFECVLPVEARSCLSARRISLEDPEELRRFEEAVRTSAVQADPWMEGQMGHVMFYARKFYSKDIWYLKDHKAYAIAKTAAGELFLYGLFARTAVDPAAAAAALCNGHERIVLGFSPPAAKGCRRRPVREEDQTFFIRGSALKFLAEKELRLPVLIRT